MAVQPERYPKCASIKELLPDHSVNPELVKELSNNYRVCPTFEQSLYEHKRIQCYSMQNNEKFACRWSEYKANIEGKKFEPFQFPNRRNLHFYMHAVRYVPSQSIHHRTTFRNQMNAGPGVDAKGQTPIPHELLMKRGYISKDEHHRPKKVVKRKRKSN